MELLAIGDIHGKQIWQQAVDKIVADKIIFIGDYVIKNQWLETRTFESNLEDIIRFKRANFERVKLLIGNHDVPFLYGRAIFRKITSPRLCRLYQNNADCFEAAYQFNAFLFTHAGLTTGWYQKHRSLIANSIGTTLAEKLNAIHHSPNYGILHERGRSRNGLYRFGGITYADKSETEKDGLPGYTQVVGHTKVPHPTLHHSTGGSIIYIDCLNSQNSFLLIKDDRFYAISLDGNTSKIATDKSVIKY
jgi:hypothetical protein